MPRYGESRKTPKKSRASAGSTRISGAPRIVTTKNPLERRRSRDKSPGIGDWRRRKKNTYACGLRSGVRAGSGSQRLKDLGPLHSRKHPRGKRSLLKAGAKHCITSENRDPGGRNDGAPGPSKSDATRGGTTPQKDAPKKRTYSSLGAIESSQGGKREVERTR